LESIRGINNKGDLIMNEIALPPFHITTTANCTLKIDYRLGQDLQLYRQFYKQTYNAEVTEGDMLREMARRFMESDREFQYFKNRQTFARKERKPSVAADAKKTALPNGSPSAS
jgi:hypothetical protein